MRAGRRSRLSGALDHARVPRESSPLIEKDLEHGGNKFERIFRELKELRDCVSNIPGEVNKAISEANEKKQSNS